MKRRKPKILLVNRGKVREILSKRGFTQASESSIAALADELQSHLLQRLDLIRASTTRVRLTPTLARYAVRSYSPERRPGGQE